MFVLPLRLLQRPAAAVVLHRSGGPGPAKRRIAWALLFAAAAVLMLEPVWAHHGWPDNHDGTAAIARMGVTAQQWALGNWIPVWSTRLQFGHGSPLPALYHRLFTFVGAAWLALGASPKGALLLATGGFMLVGGWGMADCVRRALPARHPMLPPLAGVVFIASNYATTDWLVRGASAEFAAMCLVPWVFGWAVTVLREGRFGAGIGVLLALLALAHSLIAVFAVPILAWALAVAAWGRRRPWAVWLRPAAVAAASGMAVLGPFLVPLAAMARFNRSEELVRHPFFTPMTHHIALRNFFADPVWRWGFKWDAFTVQFDQVLLAAALLFLVAGAAAAWQRLRGRAAADAGWSWRLVLWMLPVFAALLWLQTGSAHGFFRSVPGMAYLQFAWRLLAYATPLLILAAMLGLAAAFGLLQQRLPARAARAGAGGVAVLVAVAVLEPKMPWHHLGPQRLDTATLQAAVVGDYQAMGEFFPLTDWPPAFDIGGVFPQMQAALAAAPRHACRMQRMDADAGLAERRNASYRYQCPSAETVALPVFAAPGMAFQVRVPGAAAWVEAVAPRTCADPRPQLALPAGATDVQVRFPSWGRVARYLLQPKPFDFRRDCRLPAAATRMADTLPEPAR